jgi:hypothetical protein
MRVGDMQQVERAHFLVPSVGSALCESWCDGRHIEYHYSLKEHFSKISQMSIGMQFLGGNGCAGGIARSDPKALARNDSRTYDARDRTCWQAADRGCPGADHRCRTAGAGRMMAVGPASCARTPSMPIRRQRAIPARQGLGRISGAASGLGCLHQTMVRMYNWRGSAPPPSASTYRSTTRSRPP